MPYAGHTLDIPSLDQLQKRKGTISIMKIDEETAQLRWLLIEAEARNLGYGKQLIQQAVEFCEDHGYNRIFLWTNNVLIWRIHEGFSSKLTI